VGNPLFYQELMKKILLSCLFLAFAAVAVADIQAPPGKLNASDKLGRAISNLLFGWTEIPATIVRDTDVSLTKAIGSGPVRGFNSALARCGWGTPTWKGSYRAPYTYNNTIMNPVKGFLEFPPEVGFQSASNYSRIQRY
jgi:hypothetical protein